LNEDKEKEIEFCELKKIFWIFFSKSLEREKKFSLDKICSEFFFFIKRKSFPVIYKSEIAKFKKFRFPTPPHRVRFGNQDFKPLPPLKVRVSMAFYFDVIPIHLRISEKISIKIEKFYLKQ